MLNKVTLHPGAILFIEALVMTLNGINLSLSFSSFSAVVSQW